MKYFDTINHKNCARLISLNSSDISNRYSLLDFIFLTIFFKNIMSMKDNVNTKF